MENLRRADFKKKKRTGGSGFDEEHNGQTIEFRKEVNNPAFKILYSRKKKMKVTYRRESRMTKIGDGGGQN